LYFARPHFNWLKTVPDTFCLQVTGLAASSYDVRIGGIKVAQLTAQQLADGVNLAMPVLTAGPIADQVKAVREAIEKKNKFHHDAIFRGIVLSNVPGWVYTAVSREKLEEAKQAAVAEQLARLPAMDAEVIQALVMNANLFEIVPVK
jgi:hypothetical protein